MLEGGCDGAARCSGRTDDRVCCWQDPTSFHSESGRGSDTSSAHVTDGHEAGRRHESLDWLSMVSLSVVRPHVISRMTDEVQDEHPGVRVAA